MFPVIDASRRKGKLKLISLVFGVSQQLPGIITPLPKQRREEQGRHCARFQVWGLLSARISGALQIFSCGLSGREEEQQIPELSLGVSGKLPGIVT